MWNSLYIYSRNPTTHGLSSLIHLELKWRTMSFLPPLTFSYVFYVFVQDLSKRCKGFHPQIPPRLGWYLETEKWYPSWQVLCYKPNYSYYGMSKFEDYHSSKNICVSSFIDWNSITNSFYTDCGFGEGGRPTELKSKVFTMLCAMLDQWATAWYLFHQLVKLPLIASCIIEIIMLIGTIVPFFFWYLHNVFSGIYITLKWVPREII